VLLVLLLVTILAGGYLYVSNGSSGSNLAKDFVSVDQRVAAGARSLPVAAAKVQRFDELRSFVVSAQATLGQMGKDRAILHKIAKTQSGPSRQIAEQAATAADQAFTAGVRYRSAVAFSYNLTAADRANALLLSAAATLDQEATAWNKR